MTSKISWRVREFLLALQLTALLALPTFAQAPQSAFARAGYDHLQSKQYREAVTDFTRAIAQEPHNADYYNGRGAAQFFCKRVDLALVDFKKALELRPGSDDFALSVANCYRHLNDHASAQHYYELAIKLNPRGTNAYAGSGFDFSMQNKMDKAVARYTQGLAANPKNTECLQLRATYYDSVNQYDKAIADYSGLIKYAPQDKTYLSKRGQAYWRVHRYDRAIADLSEYLKSKPRDEEALFCRALCYRSLHRDGDALKDFDTILAIPSTDARRIGEAAY
ncbi:MAG: tetratricopeptide repeat protein, partial [Cyanobacteria bacterium SZAS LIN-2]|nr:tetratricopeptide repeat protein [Cyanobacteria bacterium SZAS LIN-2]